ncbi:hypothetical protein Y032_0718g1800 [Ancylostoma ceylanicum]|uniref:Uncharacterized protein n=1 Tax=Ancylostoma ceylanicum TaxID=53326 RepID=A0A016WGK6_9BILA|nr:hypothetical protein Y032_0718g1800 [Ancylostoma ceylanicum]
MRVAVLILFLVFCVASTMSRQCWKGKGCLPPQVCRGGQCVGRTYSSGSYHRLLLDLSHQNRTLARENEELIDQWEFSLKILFIYPCTRQINFAEQHRINQCVAGENSISYNKTKILDIIHFFYQIPIERVIELGVFEPTNMYTYLIRRRPLVEKKIQKPT